MKFVKFQFSVWQPCKFDYFTFHDIYEKNFDFFQLFVMSTILRFVFFDYSSASHFLRQFQKLAWTSDHTTLSKLSLSESQTHSVDPIHDQKSRQFSAFGMKNLCFASIFMKMHFLFRNKQLLLSEAALVYLTSK